VIAELLVLFGVFFALLALRTPVFLAMALSAVAYATAFAPVMPPLVVVQTFLQGLDSTAFTAIPFFFLAGEIMNAGGMSRRLLRLARALIAHIRGGLGHANIAASVVFAGVSGSAVADAAAVGSVMMPAMKRDGYGAPYAAAITASSATIGLVIPPSIPMVIFGLFTGTSIGGLFLAGVVPGLLMAAFLFAASWWISRRRNYPSVAWQGVGELAAALRDSVLALLMPVLVVACLVGGVATTAEIGAVAAIYAALVSALIYRETGVRDLWRAIENAAMDSARVLIVIAISGAFVWIIANMGVAQALAGWLDALGLPAPWLLAAIAVVLVLAGTVLEPVTLLVVVVPMLVPAAQAAGIDMIHLGIVVVLAGAIGLVTPPVGILIYLTAAQAGAPAVQVIRELTPFLAALLLLLAALVALPGLSLWLPELLR
jgi:tripartite ATP-independent transporter DctM subunit